MKKHTILKNTLWIFFGKVAAMFFLMMLDIIIARFLSIENYAEWAYFFAVLTMLFYIGWLGINTSSKVSLSKCIVKKDRDSCLWAALCLRIIVSVTVCLLIFIIMPGLSIYMGFPNKYPNLESLLKWSAILVFFNSFTEFLKELCVGDEKYKNLFLITTCEYGGYFLFSFIILQIFCDVHAVAIGYMLSGIVILFLGIWTIKKEFGFQYENVDVHYIDYLKNIAQYAVPIAFISFGGLVLVEMDTFMLGLLSSKIDVATYNIAKNLCSKATHINYALTVGTMTHFSVITVKNFEKRKMEFIEINKINLLIIMIVTIVILIFSPFFISIIYGASYTKSGMIMRFLVPYYALYSVSNFYSSFLDFRGKARFRSICYISVVIINLTLNYLWIPVYGAKGAAIATDISLLPYTILVTLEVFRQFHGQSIK